ncbi:MAG: lysophospholipid acyltransferase family protein [Sulfurimonas sp.]|nr:lysophospholipid acyltransferase family protein [Sulfurimonas sp.]
MAKKLFRAIALMIVPFLGALFIRLIYATNKKELEPEAVVDEKPLIFACWHGELLMLPYLYRRYRKIPHAKVLISNHFDGLLISKTIESFGLETIAGSTNRNAAKVLIQGIRALKDGYDIGITPDGPKGPRHEVADGIIIMAQKTGTKIVLIRMLATKYWQFSSWDKFTVPKPFGTLKYYATLPIDVSGLELQDARALIKEGLEKYET